MLTKVIVKHLYRRQVFHVTSGWRDIKHYCGGLRSRGQSRRSKC